jgi:hypothetical protein
MSEITSVEFRERHSLSLKAAWAKVDAAVRVLRETSRLGAPALISELRDTPLVAAA